MQRPLYRINAFGSGITTPMRSLLIFAIFIVVSAMRVYSEEPDPLTVEKPDMGKLFNVMEEASRQIKESERLAEQELEGVERQYGSDHLEVAKRLYDLGQLQLSTFILNFDKAERLFTRCLVIRGKIFGPSHPDVLKALYALGQVYEFQGKHGEARATYKKLLGSDYPGDEVPTNDLALLAFKKAFVAVPKENSEPGTFRNGTEHNL